MKYFSRRWEALPAGLGPSSILERVLIARGVEDIPGFLHPRAPLQPLPGAEKAQERIRAAIVNKENICIFADYDADGITSAAIAMRFFRHHGLDPFLILPSRYEDGYGLHGDSLHRVPQETDLIITVDCGITSVEEVRILSTGMDIIITDHHEPGDVLPKEAILVCPKLEDYPFPHLSGSGVIYRLLSEMGLPSPPGLASIAMIGTVADVMPLRGENRYIVKKGLRELYTHPIAGISAWLGHIGADARDIRSEDISYRLAPMLNAPGRLEHPLPAYTLLSTDDPLQAEKALQLCLDANERRKALTEIMTKSLPQFTEEPAILRYSDQWLTGLAGLAAGKTAERLSRPAIFFAKEEDLLKGSARAPEGFHLLEALRSAERYLRRYGGHKGAAGLELAVEDFPAFESAIHDYVKAHPPMEERVPLWYLEIQAGEVGIHLLDQLEELEPFGKGNEPVRFLLRGVQLSQLRAMGQTGRAFRLDFRKGSSALELVSFTGEAAHLCEGAVYDILFEVKRNVFRGVLRMQLQLVDIRERSPFPPYTSPFFAPYYAHLHRLIGAYDPKSQEEIMLLAPTRLEHEGEEANFHFDETILPNLQALLDSKQTLQQGLIDILPTRETLVDFYRELKSKAPLDWRDSRRAAQRAMAIKIFEELGIISYTKGSGTKEITFIEGKQKFRLEDSQLYRNAQAILEAWSELY